MVDQTKILVLRIDLLYLKLIDLFTVFFVCSVMVDEKSRFDSKITLYMENY
jgi:hypothetical protein